MKKHKHLKIYFFIIVPICTIIGLVSAFLTIRPESISGKEIITIPKENWILYVITDRADYTIEIAGNEPALLRGETLSLKSSTGEAPLHYQYSDYFYVIKNFEKSTEWEIINAKDTTMRIRSSNNLKVVSYPTRRAVIDALTVAPAILYILTGLIYLVIWSEIKY